MTSERTKELRAQYDAIYFRESWGNPSVVVLECLDEIERTKKALEYYADEETWTEAIGPTWLLKVPREAPDYGKTARDCLKGVIE